MDKMLFETIDGAFKYAKYIRARGPYGKSVSRISLSELQRIRP